MIIKLNPTEKGISLQTVTRISPRDLAVLTNPQNIDECASRASAFEKDMHIVAYTWHEGNDAFVKIVSDPEEIFGTQKEINVKISEFIKRVTEYIVFICNLAEEIRMRKNEESELKLITPDMMFDDTLFETESGKKLLNALRKSVEQEEKSFDNCNDFIDSLIDEIKEVSASGTGGIFVIQIPKKYDKKCN